VHASQFVAGGLASIGGVGCVSIAGASVGCVSIGCVSTGSLSIVVVSHIALHGVVSVRARARTVFRDFRPVCRLGDQHTVSSTIARGERYHTTVLVRASIAIDTRRELAGDLRAGDLRNLARDKRFSGSVVVHFHRADGWWCTGSEVREVKREASACIRRDTAGSVDVLRNVCTAAGRFGSRMLNVRGSWGCWTAEHRLNGNLGIDGGRQSNEEYGGGEGLGKHFEKI